MELILITGMLSLMNLLLVQQIAGETTTVRPEAIEKLTQKAPVGPQSLQEAIIGMPSDTHDTAAVDYR